MSGDITGLYRIRGLRGAPGDVHVTDGTMALEMPEERYHANGYQPAVDRLPWKEEYDAARGGRDAADRT